MSVSSPFCLQQEVWLRQSSTKEVKCRYGCGLMIVSTCVSLIVQTPCYMVLSILLKFLSHISLQIINARSKNTEESWGCDRLTCVRQSFTVRATKKFVHVPRSSSSNLNQTEETCVLANVQHSLVVTILALAYISVPCIHNYGIVLS